MKHGVLGTEYAAGRNNSKALKYRLGRRTSEVKKSIETFFGLHPEFIIDLGTAEGKMLSEINNSFPKAKCIRVEYNPDLVKLGRKLFPTLEIYEGDVQDLSSYSLSKGFDVAIATAVIEHVDNPEKFIFEVNKILKVNGILIITAPDPFWENIATKVGHFKDGQHNEVPNLQRLTKRVTNAGMDVLKAEKFMLSPVGMPAEISIERFFRKLGLSFMMANQLLVAKKSKA
ncbi:MAG: hypothetical protein CBB97_19340 [Candidatus Endolissoclinum sp. TMED37]|nr:MAG: hypothetical protein CBB97_19340 [Candidatus Endolissoclinum sp. TMED37]|tara:strand:+ start:1028 stop:1714 length:687 start_codon:yes stop_codon:yes gene_type:complete